jgi:cytochrome b6-f complex iron-sulfur subunit
METFSRYEFLRRLGFGGSALLAAICLQSCKEENNISSSPKDFTIDLNQAAYSRLKTAGEFLIEQDVVIACTGSGTYAAVTVICSHEGEKRVGYQAASNDFRCSAHGALFGVDGKGKNGLGSKGLRTYQTALNGNLLRIFS